MFESRDIRAELQGDAWARMGRWQLAAVVQALDRLGLRQRLAVAALAKQREEVFVPGRPEPLAVAGGANSPGLLLLRQCRDEAHAFAVRSLVGLELGGSGFEG